MYFIPRLMLVSLATMMLAGEIYGQQPSTEVQTEHKSLSDIHVQLSEDSESQENLKLWKNLTRPFIWRDKTGQYRRSGKFYGFDGTYLYLEDSSGDILNVPKSALDESGSERLDQIIAVKTKLLTSLKFIQYRKKLLKVIEESNEPIIKGMDAYLSLLPASDQRAIAPTIEILIMTAKAAEVEKVQHSDNEYIFTQEYIGAAGGIRQRIKSQIYLVKDLVKHTKFAELQVANSQNEAIYMGDVLSALDGENSAAMLTAHKRLSAAIQTMASQSPTSQSPTSQSPTSQSPTSQSPTSQSPTSQSETRADSFGPIFHLDTNALSAETLTTGGVAVNGFRTEFQGVDIFKDTRMGQVARLSESKLEITPALIGQKDSYTICMWFKPRLYVGSEGWSRIFGEDSSSYIFGIAVNKDGRIRLNTWDRNFVEQNRDTEPGVVQFGEWNFVAVVVQDAPTRRASGTHGTACATIYVKDRDNLKSYSINALKTGMPSRKSCIGPFFYRGDIADFSVFDRALNEDEVDQVMSTRRVAELSVRPPTQQTKIPSDSDMFDVRNGAVIIKHSGTNLTRGFDIEYMLGKPGEVKVQPSFKTNVDDPDAIFSDAKLPSHFVEFKTERPIVLRRIALTAAHDMGVPKRAFAQFTLLAANPESGEFETVVFRYHPAIPYSQSKPSDGVTLQDAGETTLKLIAEVPPIKAQLFRAEFVPETAANKTPYRGPRIIELDGFE